MGKMIPKNVKVAAMKSYVADGNTLRQAAMENGVNPESLRQWLGSKVRKRGTHLRKENRVTKEETNAIVFSAPPMKPNRKPRTSKASELLNRSNKRWSMTEDELLRDAVLSKMTVKETVELLGRTSVAIYCRKNYLTDNGFINEDTRFIVPTGIKRIRKKMETLYEGAEVEAVIEDVLAAKPTPTEEPTRMGVQQNIELSELAKVVREYGVNITVSVTDKGMEVKMSN